MSFFETIGILVMVMGVETGLIWLGNWLDDGDGTLPETLLGVMNTIAITGLILWMMRGN